MPEGEVQHPDTWTAARDDRTSPNSCDIASGDGTFIIRGGAWGVSFLGHPENLKRQRFQAKSN
jgi:hypothetical protein